MSTSENAMKDAKKLAGKVYQQFMEEIVEQHVLNDRRNQRPLSDTEKRDISNKKAGDTRFLYLMTLSGKGGWTDNPDKQASYLKNSNITLLDHLLSVVRGSLMLMAIDKLNKAPDMDQEWLIERLKVVAVIAFLHDLDKIEQLKRDAELTLSLIEEVMKRYGINEFLGEECQISAEQIRYLIEHVEDTQAHRNLPAEYPPREYEQDVKVYVKLADKLDGIWQEFGAQGGLEKVLERIRTDQSLDGDTLLAQWKTVDLFDPHHPFLLDELQRNLSVFSTRLAGIPPLLEVHQDGRLFMLLPEQKAEAIQQKAIQRLCRYLPFGLQLSISNRGVPELLNGQPDYEALKEFLADIRQSRELGKLFGIKRSLVTPELNQQLDELLKPLGLAPGWPKGTGQMVSPYPDVNELSEQSRDYLIQASLSVLLMGMKLPVTKKNGLPDYDTREERLLACIDDIRPEWLSDIDDAQSRRILSGLWLVSLAKDNTDIEEQIWGEEQGVLKQWLEGDEEQVGFNCFFAGEGESILQSVHDHFHALLNNKVIRLDRGKDAGRCLFTDEPVAKHETINQALGLYEVKVSAFSSRDQRPESVTSDRAVTHVGHVSIAEHKLRQDAFDRQGGKPSGVPTLISSPVTTGLFGALILDNESVLKGLSVYDLSRKKIEKGKVTYRGLEAYRLRYRMARFERMPEKTVNQVDMMRLILSAAMRIGRPIHIYRGLPTFQKAFFYYDALPSVLAQIIGGDKPRNELRIEQIPAAIDALEIARVLADTHGLGYDVLRLYATPKTRFRAICLAYCHLKDADNAVPIRTRLHQHYLSLLEQKQMITESDGALVRLGQAAARIQRNPGRRASANDEVLVFNLTLETALKLRAAGQTDASSLVYGIAGELDTNLVRKEKQAARKHRDDVPLDQECLNFARQFVNEVWEGVLKERPPSQSTRRVLASVYRMAFMQASIEKSAAAGSEAETV
ncbi:MAG: Unknown protein [uncultured Thiotrichaceae bacterium]|uniref:CRISPR-associated protein Csc3 n=1 Tax=uncultured Thiotrichaceae bacterium TaxID=298394 RepID=A0A6S6TFH3_9GAMM|nr:MAG: Unknown protein [uncultured Thiotrichaceae bacterium]